MFYASASPSNSTMAESATQTKHFRITKLKLPTLASENIKSQLQLIHGDSRPVNFDLRFEAHKAPPLLAAFLSNEIFRNLGSSGVHQRFSMRLQRPGFIPNNPLNMFNELFSDIKQELAMGARNFSLTQSEYFEECMRRSRPRGINRAIMTPETANGAVLQFRNNLSFLVRLFFEVMEGPDNMKFKTACEIPSLPDIYSTKESKASCDHMPSLPNSNMKMLTDSTSYKNGPTSGFNSLFNNIKRK